MSRIKGQPLGYAQPSIAGTAKSGTALSGGTVLPVGYEKMLVVCESGSVRWRDDGGTPTASVGMPMAATSALDYDGNIANFSVIAQSGTAVLSIAYYGAGAFNA